MRFQVALPVVLSERGPLALRENGNGTVLHAMFPWASRGTLERAGVMDQTGPGNSHSLNLKADPAPCENMDIGL